MDRSGNPQRKACVDSLHWLWFISLLLGPPTKLNRRRHEMPLQFEVFSSESGAFCYPDENFHALVDEFDDLIDAHQMGQLADKPYIAALERLITATPDFVDAHAH